MKPFFATPMYGGMCSESYFSSMVRLIGLLAEKKIPYNVATLTNESLVTRARNMLVKMFLGTDSTHLFFIDADIQFNSEDAYRILDMNRPVVAGAYPMKGVLYDNLIGNTIASREHAIQLTTAYALNFHFESEDHRKNLKATVVDGLAKLYDAGTGFMCIRRDVIEKMIDAYPETKYAADEIDSSADEHYALFDTMIENGRYLSEDYTFCRRWQALGGEIWLDPQTILNHTGTMTFQGTRILT